VAYGCFFSYGALKCPLEALRGRESSLDNAIAGATVGYVATQSGYLRVPFYEHVPTAVLRRGYPAAGAFVYGGLAYLFGGFAERL
jgi:hypothetical protein